MQSHESWYWIQSSLHSDVLLATRCVSSQWVTCRMTVLPTTRPLRHSCCLMCSLLLSQSLHQGLPWLFCSHMPWLLNAEKEGELDTGSDNKFCNLQKSLYGLMQSPSLWDEKLKDTLTNFKYTPLEFRKCFFKFEDDTHGVTILVYVDYLVMLSSKLSRVKLARSELKSRL